VRISKSLYIRGLQCSKSSYLEVYRRQLKTVTDSAQSLFRDGQLVGRTAQGLFPGGVHIPYIPGAKGQDDQVRLTQAAMDSGVSVIYEAAFLFGDAFAKVDILVRAGNGTDNAYTWNIYEVKSGTSAEATHLEDIAFQYYVLTGAGVRIGTVSLVYLNSEYVRQGELNLNELFTCKDLTEYAKAREGFVSEELVRQRVILVGEMPEQGIGKHCAAPYDCEYKQHCWSHIPKDSVFDLRGNGVNKYDLYNQGIIKQEDVPAEILKKMNAKQRQQVEATINRVNSYNPKAVAKFLDGLKFPVSNFDVETFSSPIPLYDGMKPYQQTAFQYSLHIVGQDGTMQHHEFLAKPGIDPRPSFIQSLAAAMPSTGSVVAFNMSFERGIIAGLAKRFPEYEALAASWMSNLVDLMVPFRQRDVYFWAMKGSYSIKYVLPSLCSELSYKGFEIANGSAAMAAYHEMTALIDDPEKLAKLRANLLKYCHLDTFGMVRLIEALRLLVEAGLEPFEMALEETFEETLVV